MELIPVLRAAIVTLRPLSVSDDLPYRSLEFTSTNNQVNIGRASKRESKNLIPARNNGLFESRVMSRNHAKLWVCFDKQVCSSIWLSPQQVVGLQAKIG